MYEPRTLYGTCVSHAQKCRHETKRRSNQSVMASSVKRWSNAASSLQINDNYKIETNCFRTTITTTNASTVCNSSENSLQKMPSLSTAHTRFLSLSLSLLLSPTFILIYFLCTNEPRLISNCYVANSLTASPQ